MRRQSIIATLIVFIGSGIGIINSIAFTNKTWFSEAEYGLTRSITDFGQIIFAITFIGLTAVTYKFAPYFRAHLRNSENDLLTISITFSTISFIFFFIVSFFFKDFFDRKFIAKSPELIQYYLWIFPFAYLLLQYSILESYLWTLHKSVFTSFLKEIVLRVYHIILIILFITKTISYDLFVKCFVFSYCFLILGALIYLKKIGHLNVVTKFSKVTRKFGKKMFLFGIFYYAGVVVITLASLNDSLAISSFIGQTAIGIFSITAFISNMIAIPQRSVVGVTIPILSNAWREKNIPLIKAIYERSSINLLLAALWLFGSIWLCYKDIIISLGMKESYLSGEWLLFLLGIKIIIDMGTGVNGQIIATSNFWKFEFITGIILLLIIAPLNYFLIKKHGIVGAGYANLLAYSIYNIIRVLFLYKKYKMWPFSLNTVYAILLAIVSYYFTFLISQDVTAWWAIIIRGSVYSLLFFIGIKYLNLSPDLKPVILTLKKKVGMK